MDLAQFINAHPELELYQPEKHNYEVLEFMAKSPMRIGGIELLYDRSPRFEALLKVQGGAFFTILAPKQGGGLHGFFSMSVFPRIVDGKIENIGYLSDFRTDGSRVAAKIWRSLYAEILAVVSADAKYGKPKYFLTAILKNNQMAIQNIAVSGAKAKKFGFRYHLLQEQSMVNVYMSLPWRPLATRAQWATRDMETKLRAFLDACEREKHLGYSFVGGASDAWQFRKATWPHFEIEKFLVILKNDKIIACALPWSPSFAKRMLVTKISWAVKSLLFLGRLVGVRLPKLGESIETIYLTHLGIQPGEDKNRIISELLGAAKEMYPRAHMISFAAQPGAAKEMKGFILQEVPVNLYAVTTNEDLAPSCPAGQDVSFEMGLV